ncbi:zinc metalloprotease [Iodidimonas muriae]|uniref:Zinc metalloprotease n=1 Tax=Iodidimonas muriae TaxID=261467 RepID=A0ABQ2LEE2_9PROT|nr:RIP metalloprotease RseP [Iodidimonas muriae]GER06987.1 zinc metalloprotease [Kordiimonadales bacterium JCM 17843]GGO13478.1 zinc metalloprotease [Iodidimonas muriae]
METDGPGLIFTILSFLLALTILVFVHEWGHYIVARFFKVRVEVFSIGFGREIYGWTAKSGTRWKISLLPLGGYVRFFGDADAASKGAANLDSTLSAEERAVCFHFKPVGQRAAIVAAGPLINFLFAILIYFGLFMSYGQPVQPPIVAGLAPDMPAQAAGLQEGDRILSVAGHKIEDVRDLVRTVSLYPKMAVDITFQRHGQRMDSRVTLAEDLQVDRFGNEYRRGLLGVQLDAPTEIRTVGPIEAFGDSVSETLTMARMMLTATGQVIMGIRSLDDLGGPVKIAKVTGEQASLGWLAFIEFVALISINLGLVNLFPIPMLDGGHLLFHLFEAIKGSPVNARIQEMGYMVGFALIIGLMLFLTLNDLQSL